MKRPRAAAVVFAAMLLGAGCNAILGNEEGVYGGRDASAIDDGGEGPDASSGEGGPSDAGCDASPADDPHNCGACGHDCLGGTCAGGRCQPVTLLDDAGAVQHIVLRDGVVFLGSSSSIARLPLDGGSAEPLVSLTPPDRAGELALGNNELFWVRVVGTPTAGIGTCPLQGPCPDAAPFATSSAPDRLAGAGNRVYWTDGLGGVFSATPDAGTTILAPDTTSAVAVDSQFVYFAKALSFASREVVRLPLDGGASELVWANDAGARVRQIVPVGSDVLLASNAGPLLRVLPDGGLEQLASIGGISGRLVVLADGLAWLDGTTLLSCSPRPACQPAPVTTHPVADFAVDGASFVWIETSGRVVRLAL